MNHTRHNNHSKHHGQHHHAPANVSGTRLLWASILNFAFTILEFVGGFLSNSLALISDAVHNLADAMAILFAYIANRVSRKKANATHTFGYKRFEIIAAFFNALVLIVICVYLIIEAWQRFQNPEPIRGKLMLIVAVLGLLANLASMVILQQQKGANLNVKAAYLHLLGDTLSSVAVILGGIAIWKFGWVWLDPLITLLVSLFIIWHTWSVLRESLGILMQEAPPHLDIYRIQEALAAQEGVANAHSIHLWRLNDHSLFLEAHIELEKDLLASEATQLREELASKMEEMFNIGHCTLQMEFNPPHESTEALCQCACGD